MGARKRVESGASLRIVESGGRGGGGKVRALPARREADRSLAALLDGYIAWHDYRGSSEATTKNYRAVIGSIYTKYLIANGHPATIDQLTVERVEGWIAELRRRGRAPRTVFSYVITLKAFSAWLLSREKVETDPLARLDRPSLSDKAKDTLSDEEIERVVAACDRSTLHGRRDLAILLLLLSCSLRASELLDLAVADVDMRRRRVHVREGKGGKFRIVPLGYPAARAVERYLEHPRHREQTDEALILSGPGNPLTVDGLRMITLRLQDRTGVHCNPHKWRHTSAVRFLRGGGGIAHLKEQPGYATLEMASHYGRVAAEDLAAVHKTADPTRGLKIRV